MHAARVRARLNCFARQDYDISVVTSSRTSGRATLQFFSSSFLSSLISNHVLLLPDILVYHIQRCMRAISFGRTGTNLKTAGNLSANAPNSFASVRINNSFSSHSTYRPTSSVVHSSHKSPYYLVALRVMSYGFLGFSQFDNLLKKTWSGFYNRSWKYLGAVLSLPWIPIYQSVLRSEWFFVSIYSLAKHK